MQLPRNETSRDGPHTTNHSRRTLLRQTALGTTVLAFGVPHLGNAAGASDGGEPTGDGSPFSVQSLTNPEPDSGDGFGSAVALSGDGSTALVGGGGPYVFTATADGWTHTATLPVGGALALSGDGSTALVGASGYDTAEGEDVGAAYVFARTESGWTYTAVLPNPDPDPGDDFGGAVSLSGDGSTVLVGAPGDDTVVDEHPYVGDYAGEAYVFALTADGWTHRATLPNPRPDLYDFFGDAVALSDDGTTALVASTFYDEAVPGGEAYVFTATADGWTRTATLPDPGSEVDDGFGDAVALSGDGSTALVGAPYASTADSDRPGRTHVFARTASGWVHADVLSNPEPDRFDHFGDVVALNDDGTTALVGAPSDDDDVGEAYLFARTASGWTLAHVLSNPEPDSGDRFGDVVALNDDGTTALVGAPGEIPPADRVGAAYVYTKAVFPTPVELKNGDEVTPKDRDGDGLYEDLDGDGDVDGRDVQFLTRLANDYRKGNVQLTDAQVAALDFDGDGAFTKADVRTYARAYL